MCELSLLCFLVSAELKLNLEKYFPTLDLPCYSVFSLRELLIFSAFVFSVYFRNSISINFIHEKNQLLS